MATTTTTATPPPPTLDTRTTTSLYALAICDALGAPLEFGHRNDPDSYTTEMLPNDNFSFPPGHFTDDTSQALCLSHSLADNNGAHNAPDQAARYVRWMDKGYMSSVPGPAFDVGLQTGQVLHEWRARPGVKTVETVGRKFGGEMSCGNGSLMRFLPCALVSTSEEGAVELARESSRVTHPHARCVDACGVYARLVWCALRGMGKEELLEKLQGCLGGVDADLGDCLRRYEKVSTFRERAREDISSSGYVVHSLEAALWAFYTTETFEQGAIEVVNLGDDADTVGAIYGGLAGAFYGYEECIPERWMKKMKRFGLVREAAQKIIEARRGVSTTE